MSIEWEPALTGLDERAMLAGWLDRHRRVLVDKCSGLTREQLHGRAVPPSTLSLLGILRHMGDNEIWWFRQVLAGEDPPAADFAATDGDDPDSDFHPAAEVTLAETLALFEAACTRSREITAGLASLEVEGDLRGTPASARWVLTHMVEEYARHNGHADLLRERIDGRTG